MKYGLIFDMDGTLWDSAEGVANSWTEVVARETELDRVITKEDIQAVMGLNMDKIADIMFPELNKADRKELLKKCGDNENDYLREHGGILYPDLLETMKELKKKYHLYIVSNCQSGYIEAFLSHYHFEELFDAILCYGDNDQDKAYNIRKMAEDNGLDKAYYIGDIQADYVSSTAAGVPFIYASYGFGKMEQPTESISGLKELPQLADKLFFGGKNEESSNII